MIGQATRLADGIRSHIEEFEMPWHAVQLRAGVEHMFSPQPYRTSGEADSGIDHELDPYTHLSTMNRGILITPFHNMLKISPQTSVVDVDRFNEVFRSLTQNLV